jgi:hypothetical protein
MSPIYSTKHLPSPAATRATIDRDEPCPACGYNLRGLARGRPCPECGHVSAITGAELDLLAAGDTALQWRIGLLLGASCLIVVIVARWVLFVGGVRGASDALALAYLVTGLTVAIAWNIATWLVTPRAISTLAPHLNAIRWVVRGTQALWIIGMALWLIRVRSTAGVVVAFASTDALQTAQLFCRAIAGIGSLVMAWMLMRVAATASLDDAGRRLNAATWALPILTFLTQAFPATLEWIFLIPLGLLLLGWSWFMWLYARAMLDMHAHVRWSMIHRRRGKARDARTQAMRQELQREASNLVRPIPRDPDDDVPIPLEDVQSKPVR